MPQIAVILAAAGKSTRFGDQRSKKPFIELQGKPIWVRAIDPFVDHNDVKELFVVVAEDEVEWFKDKYRANLAFMNVRVVAGGKERADSVENALQQVSRQIDFVAVHDAARPLITKEWVDQIFATAFKSGAAIPACRMTSTVKKVANGAIEETVPREQLWAAQTPQVFKREVLDKAYAKRNKFQPTDEAQLVERLGYAVSIVECSSLNMKITTQEDLKVAQALLPLLPNKVTLKQMHPFASDNPHLFDNL